MKHPTSVRLPALTTRQLAELISATGLTQSEVISTAIDRMYQQEIKTMTSKTIVIEQKMSGTGTIHDLASQHFDREIIFDEGDQYAIVLAAYYGNGDLYYTARNADEAIRIHEEKKEYSHGIIDRNGDIVTIDELLYGKRA